MMCTDKFVSLWVLRSVSLHCSPTSDLNWEGKRTCALLTTEGRKFQFKQIGLTFSRWHMDDSLVAYSKVCSTTIVRMLGFKYDKCCMICSPGRNSFLNEWPLKIRLISYTKIHRMVQIGPKHIIWRKRRCNPNIKKLVYMFCLLNGMLRTPKPLQPSLCSWYWWNVLDE